MLVRIVVLMCLFLPLSANGADKTVSIGLIYGDGGRTAEGGSLSLLGTRFAVEDLNHRGGLLGRKIDLVELNNNDNPLDSKQAAEKAVKAGVVAVIGPESSSHALLAGAVLQQAGIPMISTFATNPDLTLAGDCIFRVCFSDRLQGHALAHFALNDLKATTAVILTCPEEKYSLGLTENFVFYYKNHGGDILWEGEYLNSSTDFRELLEKVAAYHPAVVFLPGYDRISGLIIRQCRKMRGDVTFLGGDSWSDIMYKYGEDAIEGSYYSAQWNPESESENETSREFVNRYKGSFQIREIRSFGMSHDAVFLLADAVRRANSLEPASIRKALATTKGFQGVTGTITMDRNGDPSRPISIFKFEKRGSVFIKTVTP